MKAFLTTLNPFLLTFCLFFFAPKPAFAILKPNGTVQTLQTAAPQKSNIQGFDLISSPDNTRLETILIIAALACYTSTFLGIFGLFGVVILSLITLSLNPFMWLPTIFSIVVYGYFGAILFGIAAATIWRIRLSRQRKKLKKEPESAEKQDRLFTLDYSSKRNLFLWAMILILITIGAIYYFKKSKD